MPAVSFQSRALGVDHGNPHEAETASSKFLRPSAMRDDAVSGDGNPRLASPNFAVGVGHDSICAAIAGRGVPPAPKAMFGPPFSPSDARGVALGDASRTAIGRCEFPPPSVFVVRPPSRSEAFGVGHARGVSEFPNRTASVSETPG